MTARAPIRHGLASYVAGSSKKSAVGAPSTTWESTMLLAPTVTLSWTTQNGPMVTPWPSSAVGLTTLVGVNRRMGHDARPAATSELPGTLRL